MSDYGTIVNCWVATLGDELAASTSIGASTLTVVDPADFSEDGGILRIDGTEIVAYTACDDETGIVTLSTTLTAAHTAGDRVDRYPVGQEKWTQVIVDDDVEAVSVRVPVALFDKIPEGTREGVGESIAFDIDEADSDDLVVTDLLGVVPLVDASYLDPDTTIPTGAITDGEAPDPAAAPTVVGVPRLLIAKIDGVANHDAVSYEWHISTGTGTPTLGDATTHHADASVMAAFETLADGTTALSYDTDYYVGVFSYDADGAAAFSGWSAATRLDPNGTADIAVGAITAANIEAVLILASTIATAASGRRIEFDNTGFYVIDSDGSVLVSLPTDGSPFLFNGTVNTGDLTVTGNMSLRGTTNSFEKNSSATLQAKTLDPLTAPTLGTGYVGTEVDPAGGAFTPPANRHGLAWYSSKWWMGLEFFGAGNITAFDTTGTVVAGGWNLPTNYQPTGGLVHLVVGGNQRWAVLCQDLGAASAWKVVLYNDSGTYQSEWDATFLLPGRSAHITSAAADHLYIVQRDTSDTYLARDRDAAAGTAIGSVSLTTGTGQPDEIIGYTYTSADFGAARHVLATASVAMSNRCFPFSTGGALQTSERFYTGGGQTLAGIAWDGTNFFSLSNQTRDLYKHGDLSKSATSTTYLVPYTWRDSDATGGTHESQMSAQGSKSVPARQCLTVTTPAIPDAGGTDDADSVRIYAGTSAGRTSQWLQASPAAGTRTFTITNLATSGTNPPSSNNFPTAGAFTFYAADSTVLMAGDQSGPIEQVYTPSWTAASGSPNLGTTGTITGSWQRYGKKVHVEITMIFGGASINAGTGAWSWSLPSGLNAAYSTNRCFGAGIVDDASGTKDGRFTCGAGGSATTVGMWGNGRVGAATPQVPATGDVYMLSFDYFLA